MLFHISQLSGYFLKVQLQKKRKKRRRSRRIRRRRRRKKGRGGQSEGGKWSLKTWANHANFGGKTTTTKNTTNIIRVGTSLIILVFFLPPK